MSSNALIQQEFNDLSRRLERWRSDVDRRCGAREQLLHIRDEEQARLQDAEQSRDRHRRAQQFLLSELSTRRQDAIVSIEEMASFALRGVYGPGYRLSIAVTEDKTSGGERMEVQIVSPDGDDCDLPEAESHEDGEPESAGEELVTGLFGERGGGVVEIAAFALRIAALSWLGYTGPLIMDEAYKSMSADGKIAAVARFLRQVADDTGRQVIFATHKADVFGHVADRIVHVEKRRNEAVVTQGKPGDVLSLAIAAVDDEEEVW